VSKTTNKDSNWYLLDFKGYKSGKGTLIFDTVDVDYVMYGPWASG